MTNQEKIAALQKQNSLILSEVAKMRIERRAAHMSVPNGCTAHLVPQKYYDLGNKMDHCDKLIARNNQRIEELRHGGSLFS